MTTKPLRIGGFGGGVVLEGSSDARRISELGLADSVDLGSRGNITAASDASDYVTLRDTGATPANWSRLFALLPIVSTSLVKAGAVGQGIIQVLLSDTPAYLYAAFDRSGSATPVSASHPFYTTLGAGAVAGTVFAPVSQGVQVTSATIAGVFPVRRLVAGASTDTRVILINVGAREGFAPRTAPGLYALLIDAGSFPVNLVPIGQLEALGTGTFSADVAAGSNGVQLYPRGIVVYNNHVFAYGFDNDDAASGDGPNRVMFSNLGDPLRWGNDNLAAEGTNRSFEDSDAIVLGDAGDNIRAALVWNGRLFFGTNRGLHFIAGYGRDSFITNGATPVMQAYNVIGPRAMIEGPDRMLYGVGDQGLWRFNGQGTPEALFDKLRDMNGFSLGYFDCIWTDSTSPLGAYPGKTNQDLVWMASDYDQQQVIVGIPFCNATTGFGAGNDTVVLKYHVRTGGFTRQIFAGVAYTCEGYFRREGGAPETRFMGTATTGEVSVQRYAYRADPDDPAPMPTRLPNVTFGPYAMFGPEGRGVVTRTYLTVSWDTGALPLVLLCVVKVDDVQVDSFFLTVKSSAPSAPTAGDMWVDTSQTSTDIGNGTAEGGIPAAGGYLVKTYHDGAWTLVAGAGGVGNRVTVPVPLTRRAGTRTTLELTATTATGRFSIEGLGFDAGAGTGTA